MFFVEAEYIKFCKQKEIEKFQANELLNFKYLITSYSNIKDQH